MKPPDKEDFLAGCDRDRSGVDNQRPEKGCCLKIWLWNANVFFWEFPKCQPRMIEWNFKLYGEGVARFIHTSPQRMDLRSPKKNLLATFPVLPHFFCARTIPLKCHFQKYINNITQYYADLKVSLSPIMFRKQNSTTLHECSCSTSLGIPFGDTFPPIAFIAFHIKAPSSCLRS